MRYVLFTCLLTGLILSAPLAAAEGSGAGNGAETTMEQGGESNLEALQRYSAEKRDQAVTKAHELMDALDKRIANLRERADEQWSEMSEATREKTQASLRALEDEREDLGRAFDRLGESSAETWDDVKTGFVDSYRQLREHFQATEKETPKPDMSRE
ncbi:hypothetical protein ACEZHJ_08330 [Arhodomonas sp. KWT2]|uniref:hypothetical protein n=1 Tax=unclassified Arhodomonas TaxID=2621637 RepID=UPI0013CF7FF6|nr:hypothetical protein [Arhodomonas sp. KWT]